jgi:Protein of unknown function (DUF1194)
MGGRQDTDRHLTPLRSRCRWVVAALLSVGLCAGASAQQTAVDLQLALMVDASGSVNQYRFELQKRGYVDAFRNPKVLSAILGGRTQSIAVTMVQWTGPFLHVQVLPWTLIKDEASVKTAASVIERTPRALFGGGTSISGAIDHAMSLFPQSPFKAERQVMDISGDGSNNSGRSVVRARDEAVAKDATINGLPILAFEPDLDTYYRDFVIGGPGAFMIVAKDFESFGEAILKKMIIEIAAIERQPSGLARASSGGVER